MDLKQHYKLVQLISPKQNYSSSKRVFHGHGPKRSFTFIFALSKGRSHLLNSPDSLLCYFMNFYQHFNSFFRWLNVTDSCSRTLIEQRDSNVCRRVSFKPSYRVFYLWCAFSLTKSLCRQEPPPLTPTSSRHLHLAFHQELGGICHFQFQAWYCKQRREKISAGLKTSSSCPS